MMLGLWTEMRPSRGSANSNRATTKGVVMETIEKSEEITTTSFVLDTGKSTAKYIGKFFKGLYDHAEGTAILTAASLGVTALLSEVPFMFTLPIWLEAPLVIPVLAILLIIALVISMEYRARRRMVKVAA